MRHSCFLVLTKRGEIINRIVNKVIIENIRNASTIRYRNIVFNNLRNSTFVYVTIIRQTLNQIPKLTRVILVFGKLIFEVVLFSTSNQISYIVFHFLISIPISIRITLTRALFNNLSRRFISREMLLVNHLGWTSRFTRFCCNGKYSSITELKMSYQVSSISSTSSNKKAQSHGAFFKCGNKCWNI